MSLRRVICPSAWALLHGVVRAARTAALSYASPVAKVSITAVPQALASAIRPSSAHAAREVGHIWIEPARPRSGRHALGEALGVGVLAHGAVREARGAADRGQGLAGQMAAAHVLIGGAPAGAALSTGSDLEIIPPEGMQAPAGPALALDDG